MFCEEEMSESDKVLKLLEELRELQLDETEFGIITAFPIIFLLM